jgi:hypothetical protein
MEKQLRVLENRMMKKKYGPRKTGSNTTLVKFAD